MAFVGHGWGHYVLHMEGNGDQEGFCFTYIVSGVNIVSMICLCSFFKGGLTFLQNISL